MQVKAVAHAHVPAMLVARRSARGGWAAAAPLVHESRVRTPALVQSYRGRCIAPISTRSDVVESRHPLRRKAF